MGGNIVYVDYDLSSWRHYHEDTDKKDKMHNTIDGYFISKISGFVSLEKGTGSAHGGKWRPSPNKPDDQRFIGTPGDVIRSTAKSKMGNYERETKIGDDGRAVIERHFSTHGNSNAHSNPHDHPIDWSKGFPCFGKPINYADDAPELKNYSRGADKMAIRYLNVDHSNEDLNFHTISDFKWCMECGGEVEFCVGNRVFGVFPKMNRTPESPDQILIAEKFVDNQEKTEFWADTADDALEYIIDGVRLRDIITEVEVIDRTI